MTFLDSMATIPEILETMVGARAARMAGVAGAIRDKGIRRVVIIGSGSSFNSALMAQPLFDQLGIAVQLHYPNQFAVHATTIDRQALHVVISQGGATRSVFDAVQKLHRHGCPVCSLTANTESPIAQAADVPVSMGCGEEHYLYRTVGVCSTVVSCWQLAMTLALENGMITHEDAASLDREMLASAWALPQVREMALAWYERHRFSLMRAQYLMFAGANDLWAVAREADIKVMEMVPLVTRGFELEEIIHGPQNAFDASGAYIVFARRGPDAQKASAIAAFLGERIGFCALVGNVGVGRRDFCFEETGERLSALEYLTFAQVMAYRLSADRGRDLTRKLNAGLADYISKEL
ncbi:MAG: SIS domain-containing protein [Coriobacteriaceae bacterium]|uniref:SIS domain-containing protein n=1 Tax=Tractidigestivibacter sp. TaxID=2847320 RepID=UPI0029D85286|nr:SIS domain-containing protein [Tractidigestivibacter sp.]MCI6264065.1 SIS domain-containing protein [Collinsella sp.]MCI7437886.1 SIS domain-containing protein [Coriobacteriaceae bacterium]MDD7584726.1 SIS domain-containing protein [Coriobacteriaceae bacterium]MDY5271224.1 SIS domain-containing protein [Tractidigestivibacter sp.]MDY5398180.1 SIS domain-containing protein [Collinsella sp.]